MHDTLAYASVRSPKQMLTSGAISPPELAACSADRIAVQNGVSKAYVADTPDQALQNASVPGGRVSTGTSLGGIPYAFKDLFDVARVLTAADGVKEATGNAVTRHSTFPILTGHPALSMPCGMHSACLPVSLQLVGRYFEEALLLRAAHAIERHDGFSFPLPDLRTLEKT